MVSAIGHFENAIFQFKYVRNTLNYHLNECLKKKRVKMMDIGCGTGRTLLEAIVPILNKDYSEVVGVDKYESMVEYCNNLEVDQRISFHQLDISTKNLPKKFEGRFDLITSFFCLHYVRDYNQMLQNVHHMLKPSGEFLYVQTYKINPVYNTYRELSKIDKWKPLFKDFEKYTAHFEADGSENELKELSENNGFKLLGYKFTFESVDMVPRNFIETLKSLDSIRNAIPENQQNQYVKDFHECFSEVMNHDFVSDEGLNKRIGLPVRLLTVHAKKS